jgi:uncharacterized iron-regulated membrane protein
MSFWHVNHRELRFLLMYKEDFWVTVAVLAVCAAIVGLMAWIEKRPKTELKPRMLPTTLITVIFGLIALMAFFHLVDVIKPVAGHL